MYVSKPLCQVYDALLPPEEAAALVRSFGREEEMRKRAEEMQAAKRRHFEEAMVGQRFVNVYGRGQRWLWVIL